MRGRLAPVSPWMAIWTGVRLLSYRSPCPVARDLHLCHPEAMKDLEFKKGVHGQEEVRHHVVGVREKSDRWTIDGVELVSVAVDYADGSIEELSAIQANFSLYSPKTA